jgi:hypothetical protein
MKFLDWLQPDTVAIKATAVYFGVPGQGHTSCHVILTHKNWMGALEQVTREEPDIEKKHCIECGKSLLKEQGAGDGH